MHIWEGEKMYLKVYLEVKEYTWNVFEIKNPIDPEVQRFN